MDTLSGKNIVIVGLGMIGGSIARALRLASPEQKIFACDTNTDSLQRALEEGVIDGILPFDEVAADADLLIVAIPPLALKSLLPEIEAVTSDKTVITDVASVKSHLLETLAELSDGFRARFVPAHPIAGSELSGYAAANEMLFQGRNVILTPLTENTPAAVAMVHSLWRSIGANVLGMSLGRHDQVLAATSHLPHLLAFSIVNVLVEQEQSEDIFRYAAGGFADFSRLASSDAKMWSDIFIANAGATTQVLDDFIENLVSLRLALTEKNHDLLMSLFSRAKYTRENFISKHYKPSSKPTMSDTQINFRVSPGGAIKGRIRVPGDKSISHRSIIFGSIANGVSHVSGFLEGEDALNTVAAFREMGVTIVGPENGELTIYGVGKHGLKTPRKPLYMGNSGTAMRLLAGLLAAQNFGSELSGDDSLSERPMNRIADPLREMGALIDTDSEGKPPLRIKGTTLKGIDYELPIASAQVKSCLLLAGLYADGTTRITEPELCRDHTERMLGGFSYPIQIESDIGRSSVNSGSELEATRIDVPADISSAAFFLVAASIAEDSELLLEHVGVNPSRIGVLNILRAMGANIAILNEREVGGEPVADIQVCSSKLQGIEIPADQIPLAIDEFPVLFVAAACAQGDTVLRDAAELRVKESDRLAAMASGLASLGVDLEEFPDGIRITGGSLGGGRVDSRGDHRIAMAFAVAGLRANKEILVENCANVATSFPNFVELANELGLKLAREET